MAEDCVNVAAELAGLPRRPCVTPHRPIRGPDVGATGERLHPDLPYIAEDVFRAVRTEMARTVEDVLARRTRALFLNARVALAMAPQVATLMADELGRDAAWQAGQMQSFADVARGYVLSA
jgi:glycerol-3-phosphate dehydrogenase